MPAGPVNETPANMITYNQWQSIKQYGNINKLFPKFFKDELDESVLFYDKDLRYIDYIERSKVETIIPHTVVLPRFFWRNHSETIPDEFIPGLDINKRLISLETTEEYLTKIKEFPSGVVCDSEPRKEQIPALDHFKNEFNNGKLNGILQAAPGVGKTFMTIFMASEFQMNTLIIVPNEVLASQWQEAILNFTNLKEEEIGIIQGSDLNLNRDQTNKKISIVKIQSLFSQLKHNTFNELQEYYNNKSLIVFDEVHTSGGATSYAKTSSIFRTPFILGLTATPYRTGVNDYLLKVGIGDISFEVQHQNLVPDVEIHKIYVPETEYEANRIRSLSYDYNMCLGVMNSFMNTKDDYFRYLADVIQFNYNNNHNIVVLLPTIKLMEKLKEVTLLRYPNLTKDVLILKGKTKEDMQIMVKEQRKILMGQYKLFKETLDLKVKSKESSRKEVNVLIKQRRQEIDLEVEELKRNSFDLYKKITKEAKIVISNPNLLSAGYDDPKLSNLIIAGTPRIGAIPVIQSIGRITRIYPNKQQPLVQYFIPSPFYNINDKVNIILTNNIKKQYPTAQIKYIGQEVA